MRIIEKMIDRPIASVIVVGVLVNGISVVAHNLAMIFEKK